MERRRERERERERERRERERKERGSVRNEIEGEEKRKTLKCQEM